MRIAIDVMGGDFAPNEIIAGALEAAPLLEKDDELILIGPDHVTGLKIKKLKSDACKVTAVDAPEVIAMDEPPIESLRKKVKSSISVMAKMAKHGQADSVISAGNTGACVAACQMRMRNLPNVKRPGIAVVLPTFEGPVTMCDVGANIACRPVNLYQYAVMASIYSQNILGIKDPRVALISIGQEDAKGNETVKKARDLIKNDPKLNFVGNVEGRGIFKGECDVAVCDGFVGNVILKLTEGLVDGLFKAIKHQLLKENLLLALKFKPIMMRIYKKYDYNEYGGAPLLGVNGSAVISHGSSKARTIKNAVLNSKKFYEAKINEKIVEHLSGTPVRTSSDEQGS
jgi:glycerol-3-phosphate acyltransferase PlsX